MTRFPGPLSSSILEDAGVYYAKTTMSSEASIAEGDGPIVKDWDGFSFIDFHCNASVTNLGYNHPRINEAIDKQKVTGNIFSENHTAADRWAMELAKLLTKRSHVPKPAKAYFGNSGTEANEAALKLCRAFRWERGERDRWDLIFFKNAFHGRTGGILSGTTSKPEVQRDPFLTPWDKEHTIDPTYPTKGVNSEYFQKYFSSLDPTKINALFIELPCQGEGGIIPADMEMVKYVYEWTRKNGILFVIDAIQCGMGRTGYIFGCDPAFWTAVQPDIITLGKALGGGLPIGATIFRADLDFKKNGMHSSTFGGGAMVMRTALAAFAEIEKLILGGSVNLLEARMRNALTGIHGKFPAFIKETRGVGAMWAHEIVFPEIRDMIITRCEELVETEEYGLRLLGAGRKTIRFMPPLNIDYDTLMLGFRLYEKVLSSI